MEHLIIQNRLLELEKLKEFVERFAQCHNLPAHIVFCTHVALDEAITNVITHGYDDDRVHQITVRLTMEGAELVSEVEDDARAFNPLNHAPPNVNIPLERREPGGLGIHLLRSLMDELSYQRAHERNCLRMKKSM